MYLVGFYGTPLPSLSGSVGGTLSRFGFLLVSWWDREALLEQWFGNPPELSVADRLPILSVAGMIWIWAAVLGWLLLAPLGIHRRLGRSERFVFSMAMGLSAISTWVLAIGLLGRLDRFWAFGLPAGLTLAGGAWHAWRHRVWLRPAPDASPPPHRHRWGRRPTFRFVPAGLRRSRGDAGRQGDRPPAAPRLCNRQAERSASIGSRLPCRLFS